MDRTLMDTVKLAAGAAGWRLNARDSDDAVRVDLEDDLHVVFRTPDGVRCVASCDLGPAPGASDPQGEEALRSLGTKAAALLSSQASALSIHEGRLELSLVFDMTAESDARKLALVAAFLNDQARWRELMGEAPAAQASPFSFGSFAWNTLDIRV